ncbi:musculin-like [Protopterus annectens]|uniref:musculin-like n=1 Tax=Protopterus annectens TaxID=7888 RepID=UPI001CFAD182|nr:musculin-like [Protopterus annectens]
MSTMSDTDDVQDLEMQVLQIKYDNPSSNDRSSKLYIAVENTEEDDEDREMSTRYFEMKQKRGRLAVKQTMDFSCSPQEGRQTQRNAANARERARMRVLSKAFSRLKTSLPWVPPDTKLSKLDTLRLASSYIAHLRQLLQEDRYESGYLHPVTLTWPFVVSGRSESDTKDVLSPNRLCGTTA